MWSAVITLPLFVVSDCICVGGKIGVVQIATRKREREILREIFHYNVNKRKWMGMRECAPQNCRKLKLEEGSAAARDCG